MLPVRKLLCDTWADSNSPFCTKAWFNNSVICVDLYSDGGVRDEGPRNGASTKLLIKGTIGDLHIVPFTITMVFNIKRFKCQINYWPLTRGLQLPCLNNNVLTLLVDICFLNFWKLPHHICLDNYQDSSLIQKIHLKRNLNKNID